MDWQLIQTLQWEIFDIGRSETLNKSLRKVFSRTMNTIFYRYNSLWTAVGFGPNIRVHSFQLDCTANCILTVLQRMQICVKLLQWSSVEIVKAMNAELYGGQ